MDLKTGIYVLCVIVRMCITRGIELGCKEKWEN